MSCNTNRFASNLQMSPVPTMSCNQVNINTSDIWSPFSTALFSQNDTSSMVSSFQYSSTFYSPSTETINSIDKSVIGVISETKEQSNRYNYYSNIPTADYLPPNTWSTGYSLNENKSLFNQNFTSNKNKLPKRSQQIDMSNVIRSAELQKAYGGRIKICTFCKTNGETELVYSSHSLKDVSDKITCPILLNYSCPECGAAGQRSHTKKYCPVLQKRLRMEMLQKLSSSNKEN